MPSIDLLKEMELNTPHLTWFGVSTFCRIFDRYAQGRTLTPEQARLGEALKALRDGWAHVMRAISDDRPIDALIDRAEGLAWEAREAAFDARLTLYDMVTAAGYTAAS